MKLLIDENLPKRLKQDFSDFEISTVFENGWVWKEKWGITTIDAQK